MQKSAQHYSEAAQDEIKLLSEIRDGDPDDNAHCCRLYDWFEHTGPHGRHICMVFEVLGDNLLSLIKQYDYRGIPIPVVQRLAKQILTGLHYLHTDRKIIHTDLKPENVMLTESVKERKMREQQPEITQPPPPRLQLAFGPPLTNGAAPISSSGLTKNQKKKIKKKQKKAGTAVSGDSASQGPTPSGDSCTTSVLKTDTQDNADSATTHAEGAPATGMPGCIVVHVDLLCAILLARHKQHAHVHKTVAFLDRHHLLTRFASCRNSRGREAGRQAGCQGSRSSVLVPGGEITSCSVQDCRLWQWVLDE